MSPTPANNQTSLAGNWSGYTAPGINGGPTDAYLGAPGNTVCDVNATLTSLKITPGSALDLEFGDSLTVATTTISTDGAVALGGTLAVTLAPGAALPGASDRMAFLSAGAGITGAFSNVPSGTRVATTDGRGSFVINYGANSNLVTVSSFAASGASTLPAFFTGEAALSNGVYYLARPSSSRSPRSARAGPRRSAA